MANEMILSESDLRNPFQLRRSLSSPGKISKHQLQKALVRSCQERLRISMGILLEHGADPNQVDYNTVISVKLEGQPGVDVTDGHEGYYFFASTPLQACVMNDDCKSAELLLAKQALPDLRGKRINECQFMKCPNKELELVIKSESYYYLNLPPLHLATRHGHKNMVELLLKAGAKQGCLEETGEYPIHIAAREGHCHLIRLFCTLLPFLVDRRTDKGTLSNSVPGRTSLFIASQRGHVDVAFILVDAFKADPRVHDEMNDNIYASLVVDHSSAFNDSELDNKARICQFYLDRRVDFTSVNKSGFNALDLAVKNGYTQIADLLLSYGLKRTSASLSQDNTTLTKAQSQKKMVISENVKVASEKIKPDSQKVKSVSQQVKSTSPKAGVPKPAILEEMEKAAAKEASSKTRPAAPSLDNEISSFSVSSKEGGERLYVSFESPTPNKRQTSPSASNALSSNGLASNRQASIALSSNGLTSNGLTSKARHTKQVNEHSKTSKKSSTTTSITKTTYWHSTLDEDYEEEEEEEEDEEEEEEEENEEEEEEDYYEGNSFRSLSPQSFRSEGRRVRFQVTEEVPKAYDRLDKKTARRDFMLHQPVRIEVVEDVDQSFLSLPDKLDEDYRSARSRKRRLKWWQVSKEDQENNEDPYVIGRRHKPKRKFKVKSNAIRVDGKLIGFTPKPYKSFGQIDVKTDLLEEEQSEDRPQGSGLDAELLRGRRREVIEDWRTSSRNSIRVEDVVHLVELPSIDVGGREDGRRGGEEDGRRDGKRNGEKEGKKESTLIDEAPRTPVEVFVPVADEAGGRLGKGGKEVTTSVVKATNLPEKQQSKKIRVKEEEEEEEKKEKESGKKKENDKGGVKKEEEKGGVKEEEDRGGVKEEEDKGGVKEEEDRGGVKKQEDRGDVKKATSRKGEEGLKLLTKKKTKRGSVEMRSEFTIEPAEDRRQDEWSGEKKRKVIEYIDDSGDEKDKSEEQEDDEKENEFNLNKSGSFKDSKKEGKERGMGEMKEGVKEGVKERVKGGVKEGEKEEMKGEVKKGVYTHRGDKQLIVRAPIEIEEDEDDDDDAAFPEPPKYIPVVAPPVADKTKMDENKKQKKIRKKDVDKKDRTAEKVKKPLSPSHHPPSSPSHHPPSSPSPPPASFLPSSPLPSLPSSPPPSSPSSPPPSSPPPLPPSSPPPPPTSSSPLPSKQPSHKDAPKSFAHDTPCVRKKKKQRPRIDDNFTHRDEYEYLQNEDISWSQKVINTMINSKFWKERSEEEEYRRQVNNLDEQLAAEGEKSKLETCVDDEDVARKEEEEEEKEKEKEKEKEEREDENKEEVEEEEEEEEKKEEKEEKEEEEREEEEEDDVLNVTFDKNDPTKSGVAKEEKKKKRKTLLENERRDVEGDGTRNEDDNEDQSILNRTFEKDDGKRHAGKQEDANKAKKKKKKVTSFKKKSGLPLVVHRGGEDEEEEVPLEPVTDQRGEREREQKGGQEGVQKGGQEGVQKGGQEGVQKGGQEEGEEEEEEENEGVRSEYVTKRNKKVRKQKSQGDVTREQGGEEGVAKGVTEGVAKTQADEEGKGRRGIGTQKQKDSRKKFESSMPSETAVSRDEKGGGGGRKSDDNNLDVLIPVSPTKDRLKILQTQHITDSNDSLNKEVRLTDEEKEAEKKAKEEKKKMGKKEAEEEEEEEEEEEKEEEEEEEEEEEKEKEKEEEENKSRGVRKGGRGSGIRDSRSGGGAKKNLKRRDKVVPVENDWEDDAKKFLEGGSVEGGEKEEVLERGGRRRMTKKKETPIDEEAFNAPTEEREENEKERGGEKGSKREKDKKRDKERERGKVLNKSMETNVDDVLGVDAGGLEDEDTKLAATTTSTTTTSTTTTVDTTEENSKLARRKHSKKDENAFRNTKKKSRRQEKQKQR